jgi:hypothetical protein
VSTVEFSTVSRLQVEMEVRTAAMAEATTTYLAYRYGVRRTGF